MSPHPNSPIPAPAVDDPTPTAANSVNVPATAGDAVTGKSPSALRAELFKTLGISFVLAVLVFLVFGQTIRHGFLNFDDSEYILNNPPVIKGLTADSIRWAFTNFHAANWHPLTWISHMADCRYWGLNPAGHHLTNVILHAAAVVLLFLVLRDMTGFTWRSAFVAALFAVHPLRAESVAWIAERKDVLSGVFFMLTLWAYVYYQRNPRSSTRYLLVHVAFILGLLAKSMLVTVPCLLMVLDYWPFRSYGQARGEKRPGATFRELLVEKIPLFAFSAISCILTVAAQTDAIEVVPNEGWTVRMANVIVSYATYIKQMFVPARLAIWYPFDSHLPVNEVALSLLLLAVISIGVIYWRQKHPWALVGWLWYVGMLVPVIGIVQVGSQAHADRYTYLPQIGLYVALTWTVAELFATRPNRNLILGVTGGGIVFALTFLGYRQVAYWEDLERFWRHTIACTQRNFVAHDSLGAILGSRKRLNEATDEYREALRLNPTYRQSMDNLGVAFLESGKPDEAIDQFLKTMKIGQGDAITFVNLSRAYWAKGLFERAVAMATKAIQLHPNLATAHFALADALIAQGMVDEAIASYTKAVEYRPNLSLAHYHLGNALCRKGRIAEAAFRFGIALRYNNEIVDAMNDLAWIWATCPDVRLRDGAQAVAMAELANRAKEGKDPNVLSTLAAAYAEAGRFAEALVTAKRALELSDANSNGTLIEERRQQVKCYQADKPFRDPALTNRATQESAPAGK